MPLSALVSREVQFNLPSTLVWSWPDLAPPHFHAMGAEGLSRTGQRTTVAHAHCRRNGGVVSVSLANLRLLASVACVEQDSGAIDARLSMGMTVVRLTERPVLALSGSIAYACGPRCAVSPLIHARSALHWVLLDLRSAPARSALESAARLVADLPVVQRLRSWIQRRCRARLTP